MSNLTFAMVLRLVDQVTAPARTVTGTLRGIGDATERVGRKGVAWANEQIAASEARRSALMGEALGVAALAGSIAAALKPAIDFERSMAGVSKVIDFEAPDGIKALQRDILDLTTSEGLPMAADGIAEIIEAAGQAGVVDAALPDAEKRAQLIAFARSATQMAVAFGISAEAAGGAMAQWRAAMGLTQQQSLDLGDAINHLSNNMNAQAPDLVDVIRRQGAVAMQAGLAETEVAALSAAFLSGGAGPEVAATALKNFTGALTMGAAATKREKGVLKQLGFSAVELAQRMQVDARGAILDVLDAITKLDAAERGAAARQLFGEESYGAIGPLLKNLDLLRQAFELVEDKAAFSGSMTEEFAKQAATTANALKITRNYMDLLAITIGSVLLPEVNALLDMLKPLLGTFSEWAEAHPELITLAFRLTAAFLFLRLGSIALRWAFFSMLIPILKIIRAASWMLVLLPQLARALLALLNPLKLVRAALIAIRLAFIATGIGALLVGIAMAGIWIHNNWEGLQTFFTGFWQAFRDAIGPAAPLLDGIIDYAKRIRDWFADIVKPMEASEAQWLAWGQSAGKAAGEVIDRIRETIAPVEEIFRAGFADVREIVKEAGTAVAAAFGEDGAGRKALDWLSNLTLETGHAALEAAGKVAVRLHGHLRDLATWISENAGQVSLDFLEGLAVPEAATRAADVIRGIGDALSGLVDLGAMSLKNLFEGFFDGFLPWIEPITEQLRPIGDTMGTILDDLAATFRNIGEALGLLSGNENAMSTMRDIGNVLGQIIGVIGTVAAASVRAVVDLIAGIVRMIRRLSEGDIEGAFQPLRDFFDWLASLTVASLLPEIDAAAIVQRISAWFGFDWKDIVPRLSLADLIPDMDVSAIVQRLSALFAFEWSDILPEWDWSDIIPAAPDLGGYFSDNPIDRLYWKARGRGSLYGEWEEGLRIVEELREGTLSAADAIARLAEEAKDGDWQGRAQVMLDILNDTSGPEDIADPQSLIQAAKAAKDLEAQFPLITAAANETLSAIRIVLAQVNEIMKGTDLAREGARIVQSLADGMLSQLDAVRAAAAQIGKAVRDAMPGPASVQIALPQTQAQAQVQGTRDHGGPVRRGMPYIVGERGREIFVPGIAGTILPARVMKAAMAASVIAAPVAASIPAAAEITQTRHIRPTASTPLFTPTSEPQVIRQGDNVTNIFHIHAAPGMSARDVAREVRREFERRESDRRADLHDGIDY